MIKNKSNIFSFDRGINRKQNGKLLQHCSTRIDAFPVLFWLTPRPTEKILDSFLNFILTWEDPVE